MRERPRGPSPHGGERLGGDERAVSTSFGYVLTLAISAILISGLLAAGGAFIEDQRDSVAREALRVSGEQLASAIADADRLAASSDGGRIRIRAWLPERVAGGAYTIRIVSQPTPGTDPRVGILVLRSDTAGVSVNVTFKTTFGLAERTVPGGPVVITHEDTDGDGERELRVAEETDLERDPIEPQVMSHEELVYVNRSTGELASVSPSGEVIRYGVDSVAAIGPKQIDFDGDGLREVPYTTTAGEVRLIDSSGESQLVATGAATQKTLLGVGRWNGSIRVFYVNASDGDTVYWATLDGVTGQVVTAEDGAVQANRIAGVGDFNNDGDTDIAYAGTSGQIRYIDDDEILGESDDTYNLGGSYGIGEPRRIDPSDTLLRIPYVDGSNLVSAVDYQTDTITYSSGSGDKSVKTNVALLDWTGDDTREGMFVHTGDYVLSYIQTDGTYGPLDTEYGHIKADEDVGVA